MTAPVVAGRSLRSLARRAYWWAADPPSAPEHTVLEPLIETGAVHTRLFFLLGRIVHMFRVAGLEPPAAIDLTFTVYDRAGREVCRSARTGHPLDEPLVWESRSEVPERARPLEGTVAVTSALVDGAGRPVADAVIGRVWGHTFAGVVDFFIDYYGDGAFITTTHSNIAVRPPASPGREALARIAQAAVRSGWLDRWRSPTRIKPGVVAVFNDDVGESSLFYYAWLMPIRRGEIVAELRNARGETLRAALPPLAPRAFARLRLSELFPSSRAFLGGQPGNLLLDGVSPLLRSNPRFYVGVARDAHGGMGVDHSYVEYHAVPDFTARDVWRRAGKGLQSPCVVIERADVQSVLMLFNMVAVEAPKRVSVALYDAAGALAVRRDAAVEIPPRGLRALRVRELLDANGWPGDFVGHAEVFYAPDDERVPNMLHHQVLYVQPHGVESVQLTVGLWNSPSSGRPAGIDDPQPRGEWPICAPAYLGGGYATRLGLTNCSHAWEYDVTARVEIALRDGRGLDLRREVEIPPHGTWLGPLDTLFPEARDTADPASRPLLVFVDPRNVATLGAQFFHVQSATGHFSSEHTL
jgi:hypothetical protein